MLKKSSISQFHPEVKMKVKDSNSSDSDADSDGDNTNVLPLEEKDNGLPSHEAEVESEDRHHNISGNI